MHLDVRMHMFSYCTSHLMLQWINIPSHVQLLYFTPHATVDQHTLTCSATVLHTSCYSVPTYPHMFSYCTSHLMLQWINIPSHVQLLYFKPHATVYQHTLTCSATVLHTSCYSGSTYPHMFSYCTSNLMLQWINIPSHVQLLYFTPHATVYQHTLTCSATVLHTSRYSVPTYPHMFSYCTSNLTLQCTNIPSHVQLLYFTPHATVYQHTLTCSATVLQTSCYSIPTYPHMFSYCTSNLMLQYTNITLTRSATVLHTSCYSGSTYPHMFSYCTSHLMLQYTNIPSHVQLLHFTPHATVYQHTLTCSATVLHTSCYSGYNISSHVQLLYFTPHATVYQHTLTCSATVLHTSCYSGSTYPHMFSYCTSHLMLQWTQHILTCSATVLHTSCYSGSTYPHMFSYCTSHLMLQWINIPSHVHVYTLTAAYRKCGQYKRASKMEEVKLYMMY